MLLAHLAHQFRRAFTFRTEAEVEADNHVSGSNSINQHCLHELIRRQASEFFVETHFDQQLYPDISQRLCFAGGRGQTEGFVRSTQDPARMRFKGYDSQHAARSARSIQNRPVPKMDTVEIA